MKVKCRHCCFATFFVICMYEHLLCIIYAVKNHGDRSSNHKEMSHMLHKSLFENVGGMVTPPPLAADAGLPSSSSSIPLLASD